MSVPNQIGIVQTIRAKYGTPLGVDHPKFLCEVAIACGANLLRKDAGSHITLPSGRNVSQDILVISNRVIDILGDAEGAAIPTWDDKEDLSGRETYDPHQETFQAVNNDPIPVPVPVPDLSPRVAALEAAVAALQSKLEEVSNRPAPPLPKLVAKGSTGRVWGHAHDFAVEVKGE